MFILLITIGCSKKEEMIDLEAGYHFVADLVQYCQGTCGEVESWEDNQAWVKGNIRDIDSETTLTNYYNEDRFYLEDIRNGMFMEVRIMLHKDEIFNEIRKAGKKDRFFIKGKVVPVYAYEGDNCKKGMVMELYSHEDLQINAE